MRPNPRDGKILSTGTRSEPGQLQRCSFLAGLQIIWKPSLIILVFGTRRGGMVMKVLLGGARSAVLMVILHMKTYIYRHD